MIARTILRQQRAAKSILSFRSVSTTSLPSTRASPLQLCSQRTAKPLAPRLFQRYASTESESKKENNEAAASGNGENGKAAEAEEALKKDLEEQSKLIIDLKDKYLRSVADFQNLQERTRRDMEAARAFAIQKFATDLLESVDNLDRALDAVPADKLKPVEGNGNQELIDLFSGLRMIETIMMNAMKKHGLVRFDPSEDVDGKPQKFDPKLHEATFMTPAPGKENGDIMHVQSKGFSLNGRVLRVSISPFFSLSIMDVCSMPDLEMT
ncbi:hypothetical protein AJ80_02481 [Polytolypa hystricis UAMH7299]|uniref:GrpE protein homolog, mitochondrial n=1 Tax=Polytolypa hystricis (strain UAMH7299) TaxID=1447883 RepID=A0A2B7YSD4_POLH7|nr:hypothetical protein AJ80_02481 [Polytolypa hystricis UAMH7299]